jgi:hypothetical protein
MVLVFHQHCQLHSLVHLLQQLIEMEMAHPIASPQINVLMTPRTNWCLSVVVDRLTSTPTTMALLIAWMHVLTMLTSCSLEFAVATILIQTEMAMECLTAWTYVQMTLRRSVLVCAVVALPTMTLTAMESLIVQTTAQQTQLSSILVYADATRWTRIWMVMA